MCIEVNHTSVVGIGTDILYIHRVSDYISNTSYLDKVFTEKERALALKRSDHGVYYAKIFSCKEAVFKSLSMDADILSSWKNIEILENDQQIPMVILHNEVNDHARSIGINKVLLSTSYEKEYVLSFAIAINERND